MQGRYVDALIRELRMRRSYISEPVTTIYIGGGTPSILTPDNLRRLCHALRETAGDSVEEMTVECNPDDVNRDFAELLVECGVNRVSMGVQSFSDSRLRFLKRRHNADNVIFAIRALRKAGIANISIDLMFGFPGETLEDLEHDISKAIRLDVEHISCYSLQYEEGTPLYRMLEEGRIEEIDEELSRRMYDRLCYRLEAADYEHYEISNFARPGYRSRHNSSYWNATSYLGIGAAAHSYDGSSRQWNVSDVMAYMEAILNNDGEEGANGITEGKNAIEELEVLNDAMRYNDLITTAMRVRDGIAVDTMCRDYDLPESFRKHLLDSASQAISNGLLINDNGRLHLTREGLYVSDAVMEDLVFVS